MLWVGRVHKILEEASLRKRIKKVDLLCLDKKARNHI